MKGALSMYDLNRGFWGIHTENEDAVVVQCVRNETTDSWETWVMPFDLDQLKADIHDEWLTYNGKDENVTREDVFDYAKETYDLTHNPENDGWELLDENGYTTNDNKEQAAKYCNYYFAG